MKLLTFVLIVASMWLSGCSLRPSRDEPPYPKEVQQIWHENNSKLSGSFLLRKGEYTEYKGLRIELVDIINNNYIWDQEPSRLFIKIKFVKMPEQKLICEETPYEGSYKMISPPCDPLKEFGIEGIGVGKVNFRESWAEFDVKN